MPFNRSRVFPSAVMPYVVGLDVVVIPDVAGAMARFGTRYINRLFTPDEIQYCSAGVAADVAAERFAARFAAKEATFKALGWGDRPTDWRTVEVRRRRDGGCELALHDSALRVAEDEGFQSFAISMSHDGDYAAAVVVAWRGPRAPQIRSTEA